MTRSTRREFLEQSLLATAALSVPFPTESDDWFGPEREGSPNDVIRIGVIGVRGRGRGHVGQFRKSPDAKIVAICDADDGVIKGAMKASPGAKYYRDIRKMLENDAIDAVSIATPNHWHSLATIWALQAGKHVYVEKPLSHNVREGRKLVEATEKYGKIVQHGTQARSAGATREAMKWLHQGGLGKVHRAVALCYKRRRSIGKVKGPQKPPASCDFDLWTGPAALEPLMRSKLHYDWHWVFNTGNGDMGNQGVHQMDIGRWGLGVDALPKKITSCGGRFGYDDDGNTANTQVSHFDYGEKELIFEVRGLKTPGYKGAHIGVVFYAENGYLVSASYNKVVAFDLDGKPIKTFKGGGNHFQNFLDAVKNGKPEMLRATAEAGHLSSALCHLGNISYKLGQGKALSELAEPFVSGAANESFTRFKAHLEKNGVPGAEKVAVGPTLTFDPTSEQFSGQLADKANALATRPARPPFVVPDAV